MRILIVEDEFKIADVVANRLRKENYIVDIFEDGEEGLDNAIKHSEENGEINITLEKNKNNIILKVSNKGKEIPKEIQEKIFEFWDNIIYIMKLHII